MNYNNNNNIPRDLLQPYQMSLCLGETFYVFNIMAILQSFPKVTASGPSGLSIQHLVEAAEVPLQVPICSSLTDIANLLASGQAPLSISKFLAGGSLIPLVKNKPNCPFDVRPIAVEECHSSSGWEMSVCHF